MFLLIFLIAVIAVPCAAAQGVSTCPTLNKQAAVVSQLLADGNAAFEKGDISKAESFWTEIRECAPAHPDWPKAVFNLGILEHSRNNFRHAIAYFEEVLRSLPNDRESGSSIMETNRNYSHRSALVMSECYEAMGMYGSALRYTYLAKTKYRYYSWCGTCLDGASGALNKRIAYLAVRASRLHIWASVMLVGFVAIRWRRSRSGKQHDRA